MRALGIALLLAAAPAAAQMYKCVDAKGVTSYSDKPCPPGGKGKQVDIRPIPSISGGTPQAPPPPEDPKRQDADFKRRQLERAQAEAAGKAEMEKHCERLRREEALLSGGGRVARITAKGERVYMDDAARDKRLAEIRDEIRACP